MRYHDWLTAAGEPPYRPTVTTSDRTRSNVREATVRQRPAHESAGAQQPVRGAWRHQLVGPAGSLEATRRRQVASTGPCSASSCRATAPALVTFDRCVASVLAQSYSDWEMCLCDDASGDSRPIVAHSPPSQPLDRGSTRERRATNGGVSAATNDALALADGPLRRLPRPRRRAAPDRPRAHRPVASPSSPEADLIYSDEDKIDDSAAQRTRRRFKPAWSPDLLLVERLHGPRSRPPARARSPISAASARSSTAPRTTT